jgi:hypothetical protein
MCVMCVVAVVRTPARGRRALGNALRAWHEHVTA